MLFGEKTFSDAPQALWSGGLAGARPDAPYGWLTPACGGSSRRACYGTPQRFLVGSCSVGLVTGTKCPSVHEPHPAHPFRRRPPVPPPPTRSASALPVRLRPPFPPPPTRSASALPVR